ncbi:dTDP-4-amino-4,6-dideoxy-D-glucose transaminase [Anaerolineae bacterium]|nr:dTDP-4-amino-4,6-dideoxy-D-glucose transaminase [Anaerolineae bacterium]
MTNNLPIMRPWLPEFAELEPLLREIVGNGLITNGHYVEMFERRVADYLGVNHCVAVSSGTLGLVLAIRSLGLSGEVILPSFTFTATAHAIVWNGLTPVLVDNEPDTFNINPDLIENLITPNTSAIIAVHMFGNPANVDRLAAIARKHKLRLIYDAAHALGSRYRGHPVGGYGDVEVYSLSPTKIVTTGEGGLIVTNDDAFAERCRMARNQGVTPDYDCVLFGMNARMSEFHGIVGYKSMDLVDAAVEKKIELVAFYRPMLEELPGIRLQKLADATVRSTYKDFNIIVDAEKFGMHRDQLANALATRGIATKKYYSPPIHMQTVYRHLGEKFAGTLPVTEFVSANTLTLPLFPQMTRAEVERVCNAIADARHEANR